MTRKSKAEKLLSIEDQIKELQEKKIKMEKNLYLLIGKLVVTEWGTNDEETLSFAIKELKESANTLFEDFEIKEDGEMQNENTVATTSE